jgi:hypothetical protein
MSQDVTGLEWIQEFVFLLAESREMMDGSRFCSAS